MVGCGSCLSKVLICETARSSSSMRSSHRSRHTITTRIHPHTTYLHFSLLQRTVDPPPRRPVPSRPSSSCSSSTYTTTADLPFLPIPMTSLHLKPTVRFDGPKSPNCQRCYFLMRSLLLLDAVTVPCPPSPVHCPRSRSRFCRRLVILVSSRPAGIDSRPALQESTLVPSFRNQSSSRPSRNPLRLLIGPPLEVAVDRRLTLDG